MKLFLADSSTQPSPQAGEGSNSDGTPPSSPRDAAIGDYDINKNGAGNAMTMSVADFLRNQIALCWKYTRKAEPDIVVFELYLDGSGAIERPPRLVEPTSMTSASVEAAENVRHAIYTCAPYRLPAERYQQWRQVTLKSDPRLIRNSVRR